MKFATIKGLVQKILTKEAKKEGRVAAWQKAATDGKLFAPGEEDIPLYNGNAWHNERDNLRREPDSGNTNSLTTYQYYQAAAVHRTNVLRDLLPSYGLIVS